MFCSVIIIVLLYLNKHYLLCSYVYNILTDSISGGYCQPLYGLTVNII
jgi:hypothetical protein